jgi:hypothetical protein
MTFIFEESDEVATQLLEKCKAHLKKGLKKDPSKTEMLDQMNGAGCLPCRLRCFFWLLSYVYKFRGCVGAWEQRKEIMDAARRFQGKTQEEQQAEYVKVRPLQRAASVYVHESSSSSSDVSVCIFARIQMLLCGTCLLDSFRGA